MSISTAMVTTVDVAGGIPVSLTPARDATLRVVRGVVWLTVDGDADDLVLRTGDEVTLRGGHAMAEGLGPAALQIVEPRPARYLLRGAWMSSALQAVRRMVTRLQLGTGVEHAST